MTKKNKKALRQKAIKTENEKRIRARRENSPISQVQLLSLIEFVGGKIIEQGHTNDYRYAQYWSEVNNIDFNRLSAFLSSAKIYDDFSLLTGGDPYELLGATGTRLAWMPLEQNELSELLAFLDRELQSQGCNHDYSLTEKWLKTKPYDISVVLSAFLAKGAGCDCEILMNMYEDEFYIQPAEKIQIKKQQLPRKPNNERDLNNPLNLDLKKLSKPWKIVNLYNDNDPITIQLGKKSEFQIKFMTTRLPDIKSSSDSYWTELWNNRYPYLEGQSCFDISRNALTLPEVFSSIVVRSPGWSPVICWITSRDVEGHLEVTTSSARAAGDFKEVENLLLILTK